MELKDKVALVTGGARGIGQVLGETLAKMGAHVILADVNQDGAEQSAEAICKQGGSASAVKLNVADGDEVQKVFDSISKEFKLLDILVNNAGITRDGLLMRMKEEDWDLVLSINLKGSFLCSQHAVKHMMKQKDGAIVNIASIVGVMGNMGQANYSASKAGLIGLTKTTAREVASRGIRVNAVAPGFIDTDMTRQLKDDVRSQLIGQIPMARLGQAQDVADSVAFLVSDRARYITGQVINVNGGMLM
ncbi:3-oxoacyl-[acyl-carrier-protein] reductase [Nitrospina watsonii]|uniref:3-oxoacyl-[acyl-carrier-protein] reductase n=1 Tax=Nitrospina watsonii TaxID=1323948 RepID=A0ABN8VWW5_9BACT|nr:3-oxoacyl-[acyl-carrier-protein] reductase [Nitrospina watsonii]CAI2718257.1 3-oxoacyl-[acyl-carrier-protein] reductase FabG [Nitrospina watsonii]